MSAESSKVAAHILEKCSEMCDLAMKSELDVLAHLLSMAMLQASRELSEGGSDDAERS